MGEVYASARDDGREAAVKVLSAAAAEHPASAALMRREATLLAGLKSPHIVAIHEVSFEGQPWIAMELLRGETLSERLRREERLNREDALELVAEIAAGLTAAAKADVLHRDLKPSNLFHHLDGGARIWKLLDFGVAKRLGQDLTLTQGQVVGTPGYIAPELLRGEPADARADVWSLAALAYRGITGVRPFGGSRHRCYIATLEEQPPAPSKWLPLPPEVDAVLGIGLAKKPWHRFNSAMEFSESLSAAYDGQLLPSQRELAEKVLRRLPWGTVLRRDDPW